MSLPHTRSIVSGTHITECRRRGHTPSLPKDGDQYVYVEGGWMGGPYSQNMDFKDGYMFKDENITYIICTEGLYIFDGKIYSHNYAHNNPDIKGLDKAIDYLKVILKLEKYLEVEQKVFQMV